MPFISTSTYSFGRDADVRQVIRTGEENAFTGLELGTDHFWPEALSEGDIAYVKEAASRNNWALSIDDNFRGPHLTDRSPETVERGVSRMEANLRLAERLGAQSVSTRIGLGTQTVPPDVDTARPEAYQLAIDAIKQCASVADSCGVLLLIENPQLRPIEVMNTYAQYNGLAEATGSANVKFQLDLPHANIFTGMADAIRELGTRTYSVHVHDNHGIREQDDHIELGAGTIDFRPHVDFLKQLPGPIIFKGINRDDMEGAVVRSRKILRELLGV